MNDCERHSKSNEQFESSFRICFGLGREYPELHLCCNKRHDRHFWRIWSSQHKQNSVIFNYELPNFWLFFEIIQKEKRLEFDRWRRKKINSINKTWNFKPIEWISFQKVLTGDLPMCKYVFVFPEYHHYRINTLWIEIQDAMRSTQCNDSIGSICLNTNQAEMSTTQIL